MSTNTTPAFDASAFAATMMAALTPQIEALVVSTIAAHMPAATAPANTRKAKAPKAEPKADNGFVTWLADTAEARAQRKASNAELAAYLRDAGVHPGGSAWASAKKAIAAGKDLSELNIRALKGANTRDAKARKA